jgi:uncharacterized membrane protein
MPTTILAAIKLWHMHPVADHFTIALLIVGVLIDLVSSLFPSYRWMRYAALTLMILGAMAAAASTLTGGWEAHKVWNSTTGPAKEILHRHAEIGDDLGWVFGALALWRILIEVLGFVAGTRPIYLIVAVVAVGVLTYQGYLGGEIVYDYGVGTAIYGGGAASAQMTPPPSVPTPIPTVYVPTPTPKPSATATATPAKATASATPAPASPSPRASASPSPAVH